MRVLIATDKFKGSLSAAEAARAVAAGLPRGVEVDVCPIADGGEGFVDAMLGALGGRRVVARVHDALGRPVDATFGVAGSIALVEMAAASGLVQIPEADRDVLRSSTYGTGELLCRAAQEPSVERILVGLGGSATSDGGAGMGAALGVRFLDRSGTELCPWPGAMGDLATVQPAPRGLPAVEALCDVENPLLGPKGAVAVFAEQKGAGPDARAELERYLARLVAAVPGGESAARIPGAGAAGGLGFGLVVFAGARLRPGFDVVAEAVRLGERIEAADVVITGEGALDVQSLAGKGPVGVARMGRSAGKPVLAIAGHVSDEVRQSGLFKDCRALDESGAPLPELIRNAAALVTQATRELPLS